MILGINTSHDSAYCILDVTTGRPKYMLEEERFNRIKHSGFCTYVSLEYLLDNQLIDPEKVTSLVFSFEMKPSKISLLMEKCLLNVVNQFGINILDELDPYFNDPIHSFSNTFGFGTTRDFYNNINKLKSTFPNAKEYSYNHHLCHAASAFYPSPYKESAILIVDGSGRLETTTIWQGEENGNLKCLDKIELPNSLGILYWLFSDFLCMEEGQTMGLAAYGKPIYKKQICESLLAINPDGTFYLKKPAVFWFDMSQGYAMKILEDLLGQKRRANREIPLTQFHADVASSIQVITEEILQKLAKKAKQLTGSDNLCLAGGVIQNCVANGKIIENKIFKNVWIQPMAADSGTALGAALYHSFKEGNTNFKTWEMKTAQIGLSYQEETILESIKYFEKNIEVTDANDETIAKHLKNGAIIANFKGASEVGPRALGGRSLVAHPSNGFNKFAINNIKNREPWRPFAPSILEEELSEFLDKSLQTVKSPFMILSLPIKLSKKSEIVATCHINNSARIQSVNKENNLDYYKLIHAFKSVSGVPVLLNTSFNQRGEPIVQHPVDALRVFILEDGIDYLRLENIL